MSEYSAINTCTTVGNSQEIAQAPRGDWSGPVSKSYKTIQKIHFLC